MIFSDYVIQTKFSLFQCFFTLKYLLFLMQIHDGEIEVDVGDTNDNVAVETPVMKLHPFKIQKNLSFK